MTDEATGRLLGRFISALQPVLPLVSVWAHGSLAAGDYQPGRSDLDLIAILGRPCTAAEEQQLGEVHESLGSAIALASRLHCSYCAVARLSRFWVRGAAVQGPVMPPRTTSLSSRMSAAAWAFGFDWLSQRSVPSRASCGMGADGR
jgi:hypothetical protein